MDWTQSLPVVRSDTMIGHDDECKKCCFKRECCPSSSSSSSTSSFNRKSRKRTNIISSSSSLFLCCSLCRHGMESLSVWDFNSGPGRPKTKPTPPTKTNSQSSKWSRSFLFYKLSPFLLSVILITCFSAFLNFSGK